MSDFVNDNIDALINSLEKTDHNNKANSDALKNSFNQEQKYQNSDEALETSQNQSDLNENDLTDDYFDSDENTQNHNVVKEADARLRNIIIELLKSGSIVYSIDSDEYKKLIMPENMTFVKSYLRNLNLEVVFNSENGLVYIRNLERDDEDDESENSVEDSSLINRAYLTPFKSVLILILRKYYHERFANGETEIVVDIDYVKNALTPYLELSVSESRDSKKLNGALKDLAEYKLIKKLNSEDGDRYLITPLIRYVIDVEKMEKMLDEFKKLNDEKGGKQSLPSLKKSDNKEHAETDLHGRELKETENDR
ncbi:MAG: DUF4194 domain-containing protein [Succinivibrio sp.]|nr:DUF4194 domain-containing protein [Succinivibrio sp.]